MKSQIGLFIFLLIFNLHAAVSKHEVLNAKYQDFSYKEVCEKLGAKHFELVEAKSVNEIDCMGQVFSASDFCNKQNPEDQNLTRAIVDDKTKLVRCEHSDSVRLSISCDKRDAKYCLDPKKGCEDLKNAYAVKLELIHSSFLDEKGEKNINCYYSKSLGEGLNEIH